MIYDYNTKNTSFLEISVLLKNRGIKNNKFMLTLYDDTLSGLDCWDEENLSQEQKLRIYLECKRNIWFYIREIQRIRVSGSDIRFKADIGNMSAIYLRVKNYNYLIIQPRQTGKTTGTIIFDSWLFQFGAKNMNLSYLHKDSGATGVLKNIKDLSTHCKNIPKYLLNFVRSYNDIDNIESKFCAVTNNRLNMISSPQSIDEADKKGRGISTPIVFCDEVAFLKHNKILLDALKPAWNQAAEFAEQNGVNYGMIYATTPGDPSLAQSKYCLEMINGAAKWDEKLLDLSDKDLKEHFDKNTTNNLFFIQYTYKDLGKSEKWLEGVIKGAGGDMMTVRREYLLEWISLFEDAVFNQKELEKIYQCIKPIHTKISLRRFYEMEFYEQPDWNLNYLLGMDVAGGMGQDSSTIVVVHPDDFRVVGVFKSNTIAIDDFAEVIREVMTIFFSNSIAVIERNIYGLAVLQILMKDAKIVHRLFRSYKDHSDERTIRNGQIVKQTSKKWIYGQDASSSTRPIMYEMLLNWVRDYYDKFVSEILYKEISQLQRLPNGKIAAPEKTGFHDDVLMGFLHVLHACFATKFMKDLFGIRSIIGGTENSSRDRVGPDISRITNIIKTANNAAQTPAVNWQLEEVERPNTKRSPLDIFSEWNSR